MTSCLEEKGVSNYGLLGLKQKGGTEKKGD